MTDSKRSIECFKAIQMHLKRSEQNAFNQTTFNQTQQITNNQTAFQLNTSFLTSCCKHYFPVKLNCVPTVNVDEKQCTDFLVATKLNCHAHLSSETTLKSDGF